MPPADGDTVGRDDFPEDAYAARLPDLGENPRKPIRIVRLDAKLALPARVREILVALRQVLFSYQPGVVGERENVETRAHPLAVRTDRGGDQIRQMRRLHSLRQLLAVQHLHFRA